MKLPLHIALPPRGSPARLPFLAVPVLAGLAAVQLASPERIDLPSGGSVARMGLVALPDAPPAVIAPPLLATRDLFAPPRAGHAGPDAPTDPLAGAVIAGIVQNRHLRLGVVQQPSGAVHYVAIGGTIAGWRLVALDPSAARLTHGRGQSLTVSYGAHAASPVNSSTPPKTEGGQ